MIRIFQYRLAESCICVRFHHTILSDSLTLSFFLHGYSYCTTSWIKWDLEFKKSELRNDCSDLNWLHVYCVCQTGILGFTIWHAAFSADNFKRNLENKFFKHAKTFFFLLSCSWRNFQYAVNISSFSFFLSVISILCSLFKMHYHHYLPMTFCKTYLFNLFMFFCTVGLWNASISFVLF